MAAAGLPLPAEPGRSAGLGEPDPPRLTAPQDVDRDGEVRAFTIVAFAAPGVPVPFVAAVVDCGGTSVRGNIINTEADPEHVQLGMKVRLATYSLGTDTNGTEAIGFGFEPATTTTSEG